MSSTSDVNQLNRYREQKMKGYDFERDDKEWTAELLKNKNDRLKEAQRRLAAAADKTLSASQSIIRTPVGPGSLKEDARSINRTLPGGAMISKEELASSAKDTTRFKPMNLDQFASWKAEEKARPKVTKAGSNSRQKAILEADGQDEASKYERMRLKEEKFREIYGDSIDELVQKDPEAMADPNFQQEYKAYQKYSKDQDNSDEDEIRSSHSDGMAPSERAMMLKEKLFAPILERVTRENLELNDPSVTPLAMAADIRLVQTSHDASGLAAEHRKQKKNTEEIQRVSSDISLREFRTKFVMQNRPCVIKNAASRLGWKTNSWDEVYLKAKVGHKIITVSKPSVRTTF